MEIVSYLQKEWNRRKKASKEDCTGGKSLIISNRLNAN